VIGRDRVLIHPEQGPVGRILVDERPVAFGLAHQHRVPAGDAVVFQGSRQIDLGIDGQPSAPPPNADVVPDQLDSARSPFLRELHTLVLKRVEVLPVGPDHDLPFLMSPRGDNVSGDEVVRTIGTDREGARR